MRTLQVQFWHPQPHRSSLVCHHYFMPALTFIPFAHAYHHFQVYMSSYVCNNWNQLDAFPKVFFFLYEFRSLVLLLYIFLWRLLRSRWLFFRFLLVHHRFRLHFFGRWLWFRFVFNFWVFLFISDFFDGELLLRLRDYFLSEFQFLLFFKIFHFFISLMILFPVFHWIFCFPIWSCFVQLFFIVFIFFLIFRCLFSFLLFLFFLIHFPLLFSFHQCEKLLLQANLLFSLLFG